MTQADEGSSGGGSFKPDEFGIGRLFEATSDAVVVIDVRGTILQWNPAAARLFGYEHEEAIGMNVDRLVPPEYLARHRGGIDRYRRTGHGTIMDSAKPYEVPALTKSGARVWIDLSLSAIEQHGDRFAMAIVRDVTDRVVLRERTAVDHQQLRDAYDSLEAFANVVSHDLKEPVRGLGAYLAELEEDPDSPERAELIRHAAVSHRNLVRLLEGLLEWSRTAMTPLEPRELHVQEVLKDPGIAAQWEPLLRDRRANLEIGADLPPVLGTPALVARLFGNLITNAIRHNEGASPIVRIETGDRPLPGHVEIVVRDNGPGFPMSMIGPSTKKGSLGRGFGLAIARRAVERLHGRLDLSNPKQGGGAARVQLPAAMRETEIDRRIRELV